MGFQNGAGTLGTMSAYYIGVHVKTDEPAAVRREVAALFFVEGFRHLGDEPAPEVVEDEDQLPGGEDWYGVMVSGVAGAGWVSVYVTDWQDSGALAKGLSRRLDTPVLEAWVAEDVHWGYTYYEGGEVRDRFADAPSLVAETADEEAAYVGQAEALSSVLIVPGAEWEKSLRQARVGAGQFAGGAVDSLAQAVGLPFGHAFTGYDYFFDDDPDDYAEDLENWPQFRHLVFRHPAGRDRLTE